MVCCSFGGHTTPQFLQCSVMLMNCNILPFSSLRGEDYINADFGNKLPHSGYFSGVKFFVVFVVEYRSTIYQRMINSDLVPRPPATNHAYNVTSDPSMASFWNFKRKGNSDKLSINLIASSNSEVTSAIDSNSKKRGTVWKVHSSTEGYDWKERC